MFSRYYVNTTYFSWANFLYYWLCINAGWVFTRWVNLKNFYDVFKTNSGYQSIILSQMLIVLFFFVSQNVVMRHKMDLTGYCKVKPDKYDIDPKYYREDISGIAPNNFVLD